MDQKASYAKARAVPAAGAGELPVLRAPAKASKPGWQRAIEVGLRSLHLVSMGLVLGGVAMGGTYDTLTGPIYATVITGALLLTTSLRWGCLHLGQGAGAALLLKLALLGLGNMFPGGRLGWYVAATLVTSVGSHMSSSWRHFPVAERLGGLVGLRRAA